MNGSFIYNVGKKLTSSVKIMHGNEKDNPLRELKNTVESIRHSSSGMLPQLESASKANSKNSKIQELFDNTWMEVKDFTNLSIAKKNRFLALQKKQWDVSSKFI